MIAPFSRRRFGQGLMACMGGPALNGCSGLNAPPGSRLSLHDLLTPSDIAASGDPLTAPDATAALLQFARALSRGTYTHALIPPGTYLCGAQLRIECPELVDLTLQARGARIVITAPMSVPGTRYFSVVNTAHRGGRLEIFGLSLRHNRAVGRVPNTDMVRLGGFQDYLLEDIEVGSSDNMGITIGRGDPRLSPARSITLIRPRVGGYRADSPHEYASIGDSGIWIVNAPRRCDILQAWVRETGDDGILVGESVSPDAGQVSILDADVADCGGNGICVSVPHGRITGKVGRTNQSGVALQKLQRTQASHFEVRVEIEDAGQLQAGDIGRQMIPKWNPWGLWIYQGEGGGRIKLDGCTVRRSLGAGLNLQTQGDGRWGHVEGTLTLEEIGQQAAQGPRWPGTPGAVRRSGTGRGHLTDVKLHVQLKNVQCPWLWWLTTSDAPDEGIALRFKPDAPSLASSAGALARLAHLSHKDGSQARVRGFDVRIDEEALPMALRTQLQQRLRDSVGLQCAGSTPVARHTDCTPPDQAPNLAQIL